MPSVEPIIDSESQGPIRHGPLVSFPIEEATNHRLPDGQEPRTTLAARVRLGDDGREIVFVSIHLYRSAEERLAQEPS